MNVIHFPSHNTITEVSAFHEIATPIGDLTILRGTSSTTDPHPIIVKDDEQHDLTEDQTLELAAALWDVMDLSTQKRFMDSIYNTTFPERQEG